MTRAFVPVPDGVSVEEATARLARPAEPEWVPLPDGVTEEHIGGRLALRDREHRHHGQSTRRHGRRGYILDER